MTSGYRGQPGLTKIEGQAEVDARQRGGPVIHQAAHFGHGTFGGTSGAHKLRLRRRVLVNGLTVRLLRLLRCRCLLS